MQIESPLQELMQNKQHILPMILSEGIFILLFYLYVSIYFIYLFYFIFILLFYLSIILSIISSIMRIPFYYILCCLQIFLWLATLVFVYQSNNLNSILILMKKSVEVHFISEYFFSELTIWKLNILLWMFRKVFQTIKFLHYIEMVIIIDKN